MGFAGRDDEGRGLFISEGRQPTQVFASMRLQDDTLGADQGRQIGRAFECVQFVVGYSGHSQIAGQVNFYLQFLSLLPIFVIVWFLLNNV